MKYLIYNQNSTDQNTKTGDSLFSGLRPVRPVRSDQSGRTLRSRSNIWIQVEVKLLWYVRPGSEFTPGWEPDGPTVCSSLRVRPMLRSRPIVKLMFHWFKLGRADVSVGLSFTVFFFFYSRLLQIRSQTQKKKEVVWEICTKTKQEVTPFCFCCFWQRRWKDFQSCLIHEIHIRLMTSSALIDK